MTEKRKEGEGRPLFRIRQVSEALGISLKSAYRLIDRLRENEKKLRVIQPGGEGGAVYLERSEVKRCLGPDVLAALDRVAREETKGRKKTA